MRSAIVIVLLTIHASLLAWQAYRYSPTIDEPGHLVAGISHWKFGRFDLYRVNPPLVRLVAALPMLVVDPKSDWSAFSDAPYARPEFTIGTAFANTNGADTFWYFTLARWACIPFSLIGGWYCYRWANALYGGVGFRIRNSGSRNHSPGLAVAPSLRLGHSILDPRPSHLPGLMALTLWCFCPNILGNGALITPDVAAASFGVAAGYHFWRWLRAPDWSSALLAGFALGLAELTKSSWVILFALWPVLSLVWCWSRRGKRAAEVRGQKSDDKCQDSDTDAHDPLPTFQNPQCPILEPRSCILDLRSALQLAAALALALYLLNLGYGFENSFQRLDKFAFTSHMLGGPDAHEKPGNRLAGSWLGAVPVPVPANYLRGIDVQKYDFEKKKWSYLRGEHRLGGWWYYYLYAMAVKMPVGTLFLLALTCVLKAWGLRREAWGKKPRCDSQRNNAHDARATIPGPHSSLLCPPSSILDELVLLAPAALLITLVSSQTGFNRYLRYVLPAFPFLYIWISQLAAIARSRFRGESSASTPPSRKGDTVAPLNRRLSKTADRTIARHS